jgi:F0F1-type ATP synthase delta subunit
MNTALDLLPLSKFFTTTRDVKELMSALEHLKASYFHKNQTFATTLEKEIPYQLSTALTDLAKLHGINLTDLLQAETFFNQLTEAIDNLPHMTLTLTFHPTHELIKEISRWVIDNFRQAVILEFVVDETIVGGAKIAFKGKIVDYSLKKRMEGLGKSLITNH